MSLVGRPGGRAGEQAARVLARLRPDLAADERRVDPLAAPGALARASSAARMPPTRFCDADVVGDGGRRPASARRRRRPVVLMSPPAACPARSAPSRVASGPIGAERRAGGVHDCAGCGRRRRRSRDPSSSIVPGLKFVMTTSARSRESQEHLLPVGCAQVDGDAALPAVAADEVGRCAGRRGCDGDPARLIAEAGQLDLDDVGTPFPQRRRRLRSLHEQPRLDDLQTVERSHPSVLPHTRSGFERALPHLVADGHDRRVGQRSAAASWRRRRRACARR